MLLDKLRRRSAAPATPTPAEEEVAALQARYVAWQQLKPQGRPDWPPTAEDVFGADVDVPDIPASELNDAALAAALRLKGGVIVRGLISDAKAAEVRGYVDRTLGLLEDQRAGRPLDGADGGAAAWRVELRDPATGELVGPQWRADNAMFGGECSAGDSPHVAAQLVDMYREIGLTQMIENYLGEAPAVSLEKWTLRCVPPTTNTSWHQDGAFLGTETRTVNVWIALSDCGEDASGLDIVPMHFDEIVETGTRGAYFHWDVGADLVEDIRGDKDVLTPVFKPGDAFIFDQFALHRTGVKEGLTKDRYALETWFFAPSHFPKDYHGIMV